MKENKEPTKWDLYQCILSISQRLFIQEKITKWLLVILIVNLLICLIQMILLL